MRDSGRDHDGTPPPPESPGKEQGALLHHGNRHAFGETPRHRPSRAPGYRFGPPRTDPREPSSMRASKGGTPSPPVSITHLERLPRKHRGAIVLAEIPETLPGLRPHVRRVRVGPGGQLGPPGSKAAPAAFNDRNIGTPHDQITGVEPVHRLRHVGLIAENLRRGHRQVGVPVTNPEAAAVTCCPSAVRRRRSAFPAAGKCRIGTAAADRLR